jgi:bisphosphoglycerate-dependent phosphoglycerate mutase
MAIQIVFETHSISEDNEHGIATGWHDGQLSERGRMVSADVMMASRQCSPQILGAP